MVMVPFTGEQFLNVFEQYNLAVWPAQVVLVLLAGAAVGLAFKRSEISSRAISLLLACFWLWAGAAYHLMFFSRINRAAFIFGALFIVQALILFLTGVMRRELRFRARWDLAGITGGVFIIYALIIYPVLGQTMGHVFPRSPTFGSPCPTTIFTFGLLLWTEKKLPQFVLGIPLLWSLIGLTAAISLNIREDFGLTIAGTLATTLLLWRHRYSVSESSTIQLAR